MPVIYIDVLLALNLFIDFLLLSAAARILRLPPRRIRLVLGALAGSALSCLIFLPALPAPLSVLLKTAAACLIIRIAFRWRGPLLYIKQLAVFLAVSAVFAGIAFAVWFFAAPAGFYVSGGVVYYDVSPLVLTALTAASYVAVSLYDRFMHRRLAAGREYRLLIDGQDGSVGLRALYDTGHHVTDPFSGSPVAIARLDALKPVMTGGLYDAAVRALEDGIPPTDDAARFRLRMIPVRTVKGSGLLPAFRPAYMSLASPGGAHTDITGAYVAVCRVLGRGEFEAIVGADMVCLLERSGVLCGSR